MHVALAGGASGVVHATRMASGHHNDLTLRLYGTKGGLKVDFVGNQSNLSICAGDDLPKAAWKPVDCPEVKSNYERFIDAVRSGQKVGPDFQRGAALQRALDLAVISDEQGGQSQRI